MFKIGDKVTVTDAERDYPFYAETAEVLELSKWNQAARIQNGKEYTVIGKCFHPYNKNLVYVVCDEKQEYLIHEDGLAAVPVKQEYRLTYNIVTKEMCTAVVFAESQTKACLVFDENSDELCKHTEIELVSIKRRTDV